MNITSPYNNLVTQRSRQNRAAIVATGTATDGATTSVRVRLVPINGGMATGWQSASLTAGVFSAKLVAQGGWYRLDAEGLSAAGTVVESATVARVGVGEVFLVTGHSVQEGDSTYTLTGADDERVVAVPFTFNQSAFSNSGLATDLPLTFGPYASGVKPGPTGGTTHFWGKFGQALTARLGVPVLILNAAIGGTTLDHWAATAQGAARPLFSFNPALRFPYTAIKASLLRYVLPLTGCRAVLVDLGQNDTAELSEDVLFARYNTLLGQIRADAGFATLPVVINRQTPDFTRPGADIKTYIRNAQQRTVAANPANRPGPDYDAALTTADRYDYIHLNVAGQTKAAALWAGIVTDSFLLTTTPLVVDTDLRADAAPTVSTRPPINLDNLDNLDLGLDATRRPFTASLVDDRVFLGAAGGLLLLAILATLLYYFRQ